MKKFMNTAATMVAESLEGFVRAHDRLVVFGSGDKFIRRRNLKPGKVALISGGGAGHEPMHVGFVGAGMLDAACTGHIFCSPTPGQIIAAIEACDGGAGCLLIVKNYDGDVMNFEMAAEMVAARHRVETVFVRDDLDGGGSARSHGARGVAGTLIIEKILGAAAEEGADLDRLKALGDGLYSRVRSMGVALRGVTVPETERQTFVLDAGEIEMGVGIHGEPGRFRAPFANADAILARMSDAIIADLPANGRNAALLFVNGFGGTPVSELYLAYNATRRFAEEIGLTIARSLVGTYVTSLDMAGLSVTIALLDDEELRLWDGPVHTAALNW
ncbi:dihydroxyacetone kinase subunit DhaK [Rhizobiaceae bacterium n13]|uniref:Dihydroxyacetone kinase subunit DhaK n=1 Tax=Ferirhizobium litorale TaxID=2927786 RepID=A0AAE3Q9Y0_9HYPH|nr:dihydroxyacetone kinase subunit DhaK [Fererhizobium litorale]MDI7861756.1 dihydroxyacetone kinase subunit DhaK [Fererhizobium litorale]MDI7921902.1 dihydroxyacetone kinase subunit DhaK [Fererhizobium litorale]